MCVKKLIKDRYLQRNLQMREVNLIKSIAKQQVFIFNKISNVKNYTSALLGIVSI